MRFKHFYELAEVYTLPINFLVYLMGYAFAKYQFNGHLSIAVVIGLVAISLFHSLVNTHNNYMDYQNALGDHYKNQTNVIGRENLSLSLIKKIMWGLAIAYLVLGIYLFSIGSWPIAVIGFFGTVIGLAYSSGPKPINSTFLAESLTATSMGFLTPLTAIYLASIGTADFTTGLFFKSLAACLPLILISFTLLLANNTCDLEEDLENNRYTLVSYIGKENAVTLFNLVTVALPIIIFILAITKITPYLSLVTLLVFPLVYKMTKPYKAEQIKNKTFPIALKALSLVIMVYSLSFYIGTFI
ncbi:prenyltransferase [Vagococcus coleopterorum]|uniref:Prenyltransferase n=1 Tax=Vagococcus coleopterorum TaxID=2714946 RepID=A0A6G8AN80_9ENTE|nr:prenyltransferase [Vagococcus coleopterorum]QIL46528.1 prenyltransferase [Vagococcus coleopterorum]